MEDYLNEACPRCGSKRKIARVWKEKLKTFAGTSDVEHTKIICTNKECQAALEKRRAEEAVKREEERVNKEKRELLRRQTKADAKLANAKLKTDALKKKKK